jgi:septal ring factor EnvC (AmiA/AmiB activator)
MEIDIEGLLTKFAQLEQRYTSIKAVLDERKKRLKEVETECKKAGFNPATIDTELKKLETERDKVSKNLETKLNELEGEISLYEN